WRIEYNSHRPHSALGYITPDAFANKHSQKIPI
ncbi:MAG: integrase core domain-containing protein, partial [Anaerolineae bacterium]